MGREFNRCPYCPLIQLSEGDMQGHDFRHAEARMVDRMREAGRTTIEIAEYLDVTDTTVYNRLRDARRVAQIDAATRDGEG